MHLHPLCICVLLAVAPSRAQTPDWHPDRSVPGGFQASLAYDEARERVVLFGSILDTSGRLWRDSRTFEWDGARWMHRCTEPGQIAETTLCYDPVRRRVVRSFGSLDGIPSAAAAEWDGQQWTPRGSPGPAARARAAAAFHVANAGVLVFGGNGPSQSLALRGDTWLLQGNTWTAQTASGPSPRLDHAMTYDPGRQRAVLFGGAGNLGPLGDTWEWQGGSWFARASLHRPSPRAAPGLTYDASRGRVVLFGGSGTAGHLQDTWEWDGTDWTAQPTAHAPSPRRGAAMTFDGATGRVVLFGGRAAYDTFSDTWAYDGIDWQRLAGPTAPRPEVSPMLTYVASRQHTFQFDRDGQTWEADGRDWSLRPTAVAPSPRVLAAIAYDRQRDKVVLFGGQDTYPRNDTWEWDGLTWQQHTPAVAPMARIGTKMVFDVSRGVCVLFGGTSLSLGALDDTWEWNGVTWQQRFPVHSPRAGTAHAMAYDEHLGRVVLFGGAIPQNLVSETWHYDGIDWTQMGIAAPAPPPRSDMAMTFDGTRDRVVLFGGMDLNYTRYADLWEWDGAQWAAIATATPPQPQTGARLLFDPGRKQVMLRGGYSSSHFEPDQVLAVGPMASAQAFGQGCAGPFAPRLVADTPYLGNAGNTARVVDVLAMRPVVFVASLQATSNPFLGCMQLLVQPFVTSVTTSTAHGVATLPLAIPDDPALRGATIHMQAAVFDGTGPLGGASLTGGLRIVAGQ